MKKVFLFSILLIGFSFFSFSQEKEEEWLEWGTEYEDFGFATGHSHCMIATDFDLEGEVRYLKTIEYNSSTISGSPDTVPVNWRIVEFDGEPLWENQIGTLTGDFFAPGTGNPVYTEVDNSTPISGHFAIALSFADSMYHIFIMDEYSVSNHTWFWKQNIGWVLAESVIYVPGAYHLRLLVTDDLVGTEGKFISMNNEGLRAYPNPFMDNSNISFTHSKAGHVKMEVFNYSGILVRSFYDTWLPEGDYNVPFNGSHLNSGIYLVRLTTDKGVFIQKILKN